MRRQAARTLASSLLAKCFFPGKESFAVHLIGSNPRLEYSIDNSCIMRTSPGPALGVVVDFIQIEKQNKKKKKKVFFFGPCMYTCTRIIIIWRKTGVLLYVLDYDDVTYIS